MKDGSWEFNAAELAFCIGQLYGMLVQINGDPKSLEWFRQRGVTATMLVDLKRDCSLVSEAFYKALPPGPVPRTEL